MTVQEAKTLELDNTKVLQASAIVDRDRIVQEVLTNLAKVQCTATVMLQLMMQSYCYCSAVQSTPCSDKIQFSW